MKLCQPRVADDEVRPAPFELATDPGPALRAALPLLLGKGAAEPVPLLRQPRVADDEVRPAPLELVDDVAPRGPEIAHVGDVGLERERPDPVLAQDVDEVETVTVASMEMNADGRGAVHGGGEGERLSDAPVPARTGDEDPFAVKGAAVGIRKPKSVNRRGKRHGSSRNPNPCA